MTTENMKKAWNESAGVLSGNGTGMLTFEEVHNMLNRKTSLDNLKNSYKRFSCLGLVMIVFSITFLGNRIFPQAYSIAITVYLCLYFATCSVMDYWLYVQTSSIDLYKMTVSEVVAIAKRCRKKHRQFMFILIPFAVVLFAAFIYLPFKEGNVGWVGAIIGGIIGGTLGIRKYIQMMNDYRNLSDED